jgi:undecaprenyl-diphosphatase
MLFLPVFLFFFFKNKKTALVVLCIAVISFLITDVLGNMLKHYFERTRPCNQFEAARILVNCTQSFSMPSNHAANAFAFSTPFLITFKDKLKYALVVIAFFVSLSRVYVGVHYPSDIIVGGLVGTILALSVNSLYKTVAKRFWGKG